MSDFVSHRHVASHYRDKIADLHGDKDGPEFPWILVMSLICLPVVPMLVPRARKLRLIILPVTSILGAIIIRGFAGNNFFLGVLIPTWILHYISRVLLSSPEKDFCRLEHASRPANGHNCLMLDTGESVHWQAYPPTVSHRLHWGVDLLLSLQGSAWNWRLDTLSPMPVEPPPSKTPPRRRSRRFVNRPYSNAQSHVRAVLWDYIVADIALYLTRLDPYFWGVLQSPPLPASPVYLLSQHAPIPLLWTARMLLCWLFVAHGLSCVLTLCALLRRVVAYAAPGMARAIFLVPCGEDWLYAPVFGEKGLGLDSRYALASFWDIYWHQGFRFDLLRVSAAALEYCPLRIRQNPLGRQIIRMVLSFFLVGAIHECGRYTLIGPTRPLRIWLFFLVQPLGIALQVLFHRLVPSLLGQFWLRRGTNLLFIIGWFLVCSPLYIDELSKGGIWLPEWIPLSPTHAVFPLDEAGWYRWGSV